ncbi:MAG TPA: hypothetical protein VGH10_05160 [Actinomycetota bacterium]|jgi:hypothetical protein
MSDEDLLKRAERALTEIKVAQGLSDEHASVLAALRLRLKGDPGASLEEMLATAGDLGQDRKIEELLSEQPKAKRSLDDALADEAGAKPKKTLDDLL